MGSGTNPGAEAARDLVGEPVAAAAGLGFCWEAGEEKDSGADPGAEAASRATRILAGDPAAAPCLEAREPSSETNPPGQ